MPKRTSNPKYLEARRQLLASKPPCHWCGQPATEADHVIEHDAGGTDTLDNLVPACKPCNSRRGQLYKAKKDNARMQARNAGINLQTQTQTQTQTSEYAQESGDGGNGDSSQRPRAQVVPAQPRVAREGSARAQRSGDAQLR